MEDLSFLKTYRPDCSKQTTSLVTIISPHCNIQQLKDMVKHEQSTAKNIRNRMNRQSVSDALTKLSSKLSDMKSVPESGIAMFSGQYI